VIGSVIIGFLFCRKKDQVCLEQHLLDKEKKIISLPKQHNNGRDV
jgi:hypothetical protein